MADNSFRVAKSLALTAQTTAPSNPSDGDIYYDSVIGSLREYHSGFWSNFSSKTDIASAANYDSSTFTAAATANTVVKLTGSTSGHIHGMISNHDMKQFFIYNDSSATQVIKYQSGTEATPANRIVTSTAGDVNLTAGQIAQFFYDIEQNRWVLFTTTGGLNTQIIATDAVLGVVQLSYAAGTPSDPLVAPLDANNAMFVGSGSAPAIVGPNTALTVQAGNVVGNGGNGAAGFLGTGGNAGVNTGNGGAGVSGTGGSGGGVSGNDGAGVSGTGGGPTGIGVTGTGVGPGAGVQGTGGSSGTGVVGVGTGVGAGVSGTGGATNGVGVVGQGTGTGTGVTGTGGSSSGTGGSFTGGSTNGFGVIGLGTGSGPGGRFTGGSSGVGMISIAGVSNVSGNAVSAEVSAGILLFGTVTNPAVGTSTGLANVVTPKNTVKHWYHIHCNGTVNPTVVDGFGGATITQANAAGATVTVTMPAATQMLDGKYNVQVTLGDSGAFGNVGFAHPQANTQSATNLDIYLYTLAGGAANLAGSDGLEMYITIMGAQ